MPSGSLSFTVFSPLTWNAFYFHTSSEGSEPRRQGAFSLPPRRRCLARGLHGGPACCGQTATVIDSIKSSPSKNAGSNSHPVRIGGEALIEVGRMILAHWLASGPDLFGQNLTQSAKTKSDPGWFCTILPGMSVEERN